MIYHCSILVPAYLSIILPIFIYPIPYINKDIISQNLFIKLSTARLVVLFNSNLYYLFLKNENLFTNYYLSFLSGIFSIFIGLYLVYSVFRKLSVKGVYYGLQYKSVRLKKIEGFPFNLKHPMYIGGSMIYLGIFLVFAIKHIIDKVLLVELAYILIVQVYLAIMETIFDNIYSSPKIL